MTKTPIDILLDEVDYTPVEVDRGDSDLPYVTHEGTLKLGDIELQVVVLNTGQRIIPTEELEKFFGEGFLQEISMYKT